MAAGQSLVSLHAPNPVQDAYAKLAANAMVPVTDVVNASSAGPTALPAIGGDQLAPDSLAPAALDPQSEVDVQNLTKAVDIGAQLAKKASVLQQALAGGAPEAALVGGAAYVLPTVGRFTSGFGGRWGVFHYGIDLANAIGTPIYAVTDGVVEESGPASGFGMWVVLKHPDGTHSVYGHINRSLVTVGQKVKAGQEIAEMGNRGQSTGPHLHFEIWAPDGTKINPLPWLAAHGIKIDTAGAGNGPGD
ncbi:M23 family metallopeptidase [Pseudonocardia sp. K10HN5]|uniref:M23 family metallopeptidase n=1 Tax=Pseudonocardia acidicola TaxID=2724939 RepID=A0ABX1SFR1_9PSEU|nr:M23 family metallopeptidase [Pseudonocardia acidicola]